MGYLSRNIATIVFCTLLIFVPVCYLLVDTSQETAVLESLWLLVISFLLLIKTVIGRVITRMTHLEVIFLVPILFLFSRNLFLPQPNLAFISYLLFFIFLFFSLKSIFEHNKTSISILLFIALAINLFIYIFGAGFYFYAGTGLPTNQYFQNKSIFSIYLAAQIALLIPLYLHHNVKNSLSKVVQWICFPLIALALLLLVLTQGRSGWLGISLAMIYILYHYSGQQRFKNVLVKLAAPVSILVFVSMFLYKPASSSGRLFIYKVSAGMLKDHWLWGVGAGQFKARYNEYQAFYFARHDINSGEALLADNTFYAFNDFFQLIIENGFISFLFLLILFMAGIRQIKVTKVEPQHKQMFIASIASLICILTGSLFSYPLQIFPISCHAVVCLAIICSFPTKSRQQGFLFKNYRNGSKAVSILISICLIIYFSYNVQFNQKSQDAYELQSTGYRKEALKIYKDLEGSFIKDGNVLYLYAQELYNSDQVVLADQVLSSAKKFYCTSNLLKLSARVKQELQNNTQAEKDYKTVVYMVPNKMMSRFDLLNYYVERKDTANIVFWSESILKMPIKVSSPITKNIKAKAEALLSEATK